MNKFKLSYVAACLLFVGCVSNPHNPEVPIVTASNGNSQVTVKFHEKDVVSVGSSVDAFSKSCRETITTKGPDKTVCKLQLLGKGTVIQIQSDKVALVSFDQSVLLTNKTEFEVSK